MHTVKIIQLKPFRLTWLITWLIAFDKGKLVSILLLNFTGHYGFSHNWINWMNSYIWQKAVCICQWLIFLFTLHYLWYSAGELSWSLALPYIHKRSSVSINRIKCTCVCRWHHYSSSVKLSCMNSWRRILNGLWNGLRTTNWF